MWWHSKVDLKSAMVANIDVKVPRADVGSEVNIVYVVIDCYNLMNGQLILFNFKINNKT